MNNDYQTLFTLAEKSAPYLQGTLYEMADLNNKLTSQSYFLSDDLKPKAFKFNASTTKPLKMNVLKEERFVYKGQIPSERSLLLPYDENRILLSSIYQQLQKAYPEAGSSYWDKRLWSLLIWQPLCIGIISIYGLGSLPRLHAVRQFWDPKYSAILGFQLLNVPMIKASKKKLRCQLVQDIEQLFNHYMKDLDAKYKLTVRAQRALLADLLMMALVEGYNLSSSLDLALKDKNLYKQCLHWLKAFELSERLINNIHYDIKSNTWIYTRKLCCDQYKCNTYAKCDNCPKNKPQRPRISKNKK